MYYNRRPSWRERLAKFMQGRNGADTLYNALMGICIALIIANLFLDLAIIAIIETLLFACAIFRFLSRNVYKRQEENRRFVAFFTRIKNFFTLTKNKIRDRKTHVYKSCPYCKSTLRLPRIKGDHTVRCPKCSQRFDVTVK